ncbi:putative transposase [Yokenella regensburgei]|nr:putative transposase [Yokenella regensburgei]
MSLSTCRYEAQRPAADAHLSGRITELALERRRLGYRRIWPLLRREGLHVNHKRVYRIYHLNGLSVKRRRRHKGLATERFPLLRPDAPNLTWSMDFVMDALANGRRIKCLTCVDDFTKECLTITAAFGISGVQVTRIMDSIALFRDYPATIRTDQGSEFTCRAPDLSKDYCPAGGGMGRQNLSFSSRLGRVTAPLTIRVIPGNGRRLYFASGFQGQRGVC